MFAFVVLGLVSSVLAKRLVGKNRAVFQQLPEPNRACLVGVW